MISPSKRNVIIIFASVTTICVIYHHLNQESPEIECYHLKTESLPSILDSNPARGKSIFFHETSCNSHKSGKIVIKARQACAVESAAKMNPNFEVYLLYVSPGELKTEEGTESDKFLEALLKYKNVRIRHLDFGEYLKGTPVENLYTSGKIGRSKYPVSHSSDVLRYLTLWKYGGIYLDLDTIVIRSLETLPPNYAASESLTEGRVAAGVLSFAATGTGHILATRCVKDLRDNFDGQNWIPNGPGVITRLARSVCATEDINSIVGNTCFGDLVIYPPESFYAVPWWNWTFLFEERYQEEVRRLTENSYVLHVWNKLSYEMKIPIEKEVPYSLFARKFCPLVYSECRSYF